MTITSDRSNSVLPLVGRLLLAAIFLVSAFGKLTAPGPTQGFIASVGLPMPVLSYMAAVIIELGGGLMLLTGYRTRLAATVLAAFSVISALVFHHALGDQNQLFHFLKNLAMAGGLVQVIAFGAGSFSFDNRPQVSPARGFAA
jgi:putative oxidoreductase